MPIFVGLDMSLTGTGVAIKDDKNITLRTIKTKPKDFKNDLERLDYIIKEVTSMIDGKDVFICIEDVFTPKGNQVGAAMKLIGLAYLIRKELYRRKLPFFIVSPSQVKKFVSGKGTCPKDQVTKEVFKKWGIDTSDDNQADACTMAHFAEAIYNFLQTYDLGNHTKPEAEVIKTVAYERPCYHVTVKDRDGHGDGEE